VTTYIALLRGVNVGGHGKLAMATLRRIAEDCGYTDVRTYIQSGNLVFRSTARGSVKVAATLRAAIVADTGFEPPVVVRTAAELRQVVDGNPFADRSPEAMQLHVQFFGPVDRLPDLGALELGAYAPEEVVIRGRDLFMYLPDGIGKSKLAVDLNRRAKGMGTARNWRTVTTLLDMATPSSRDI
jgi:uncharacterized protein (DUF1697 family)